MSISGGIIVVENDDVGAPKLCAVARQPFGPLARIGGAVGVAGCWNTEFPEIVGVLLTFNNANDLPCVDCLPNFIYAIENCRIDAFDSPFPAARSIWPFEPKGRFTAG